LAERGHYPINHTVVIKDDVLAAYPNLAEDAFGAFAESKRRYIDRLKSEKIANPTGADRVHQRIMDIKADPLPYGIEPNRQILEDLIRHARMQHIIKHPATAEQLFVPSTLRLVG
jgi:4,5-dihydroxyphthalate decarboxylase